MSVPGVEVNFPGPSPYEHRVSTVGATTGEDVAEEVVTPRQEAAQTALKHQAEDEAKLSQRKQAHAEKVAGVELQNVELEQFAEESIEKLRNGPQAMKAREYIDWSRGRLREQQEKLDKMPAPALFADRDGWGKIRLGIGMAMAGLGDGMMASAMIRAGHAPQRGSTVDSIIERDLDRQRAAIGRQKDSIVMARTGLDDAKEARNALLADIELKGRAMYRQVGLLTRQRLAGLKMEQPAIDATKEVLDALRGEKEQEAKFADAHGKNVKSRWDSAKTTVEDINRTPTAGSEGKIPGQQAALARQALAELEKLEGGQLPNAKTLKKLQDNELVSSAADTAIEGGKPVSGTISLIGRSFDEIPRNRYDGLSDADRITAQTMDRSMQLLMHVMTGAGASVAEKKAKAEAFGFTPNDTQASMKAKISGAKELARQFITAPAGGAVKPDAVIPPGGRAERPQFTRARVDDAKRRQADKNTPRKEREELREYLRDAAAAGVK